MITVLEDIALFTYAVPTKRLAPLLTSKLELDTFPAGEDGSGYVGTLCGRVKRSRPGLHIPAVVVEIAAHFAYVKKGDTRSVYLFRLIIAPPLLGTLAHLLVPSAGPGSSGERRRPTFGTSLAPHSDQIVRYRVDSPDGGVDIEIAELAKTADDEAAHDSALVTFLTRRPQLHFWISGRYLWKIPVEYREPMLCPAHAVRSRIPLWQEMGLLSSAEIETPAAVFTCSRMDLLWRTPHPAFTF